MTFTVVLVLLGALLLLIVGINMMQQHRERVENERRAELSRQRAIIEESEDLLLSASKLPVSKALIVMLHKRCEDALKIMQNVSTESAEVSRRLKDRINQRQSAEKSYTPITEDTFAYPDGEKASVQFLQALKKLKLVVRSEHNKGRLDTSVFAEEEKRIDRLLLRLTVENTLKRALAAYHTRQFGSAREVLEKVERVLANQPVKDQYIQGKSAEVERLLEDINTHQRQQSEDEINKRKAKEQDELDVLFQPKKKW
jgi:hypothetical protein